MVGGDVAEDLFDRGVVFAFGEGQVFRCWKGARPLNKIKQPVPPRH